MTTVTTSRGVVRGDERDGVQRYRGIRYATAERFRPPVPVEAWAGELDATAFGPIAPQPPGAQFQSNELAQAEDCLSLNVWTPGSDGSRPVLVWIHGGAFRTGSSASPLYEGTALAARGDVVVVSLNYRLGALGFLAHPDLADGDGPWANWGLLDQIEALRWVRDEIAAFGGDPGNVTIFGESAGAASVTTLMAMPEAQGLFHKAIAQSGAPLTTKPEVAIALAEQLVELTGAGDVAGLRDVPFEQLVSAQAQVESPELGLRSFAPTVDRRSVTSAPFRLARDGDIVPVPLLIGTNVDEWKLWAPMDPHSRDLDADRLRGRLDKRFPDGAAEQVITGVEAARRARGEAANPNDLFFAIESERIFRVPAVRLADLHRTHAPVFTYLFEWGSPAMKGWLGACHGLEIAFVFGNQGRGELAAFTGSGPEADRLAETMMDAWIAFARSGDPSTESLPWPAHDPAQRPTMVFGLESRLEHAPREEERALIDAVLPG